MDKIEFFTENHLCLSTLTIKEFSTHNERTQLADLAGIPEWKYYLIRGSIGLTKEGVKIELIQKYALRAKGDTWPMATDQTAEKINKLKEEYSYMKTPLETINTHYDIKLPI